MLSAIIFPTVLLAIQRGANPHYDYHRASRAADWLLQVLHAKILTMPCFAGGRWLLSMTTVLHCKRIRDTATKEQTYKNSLPRGSVGFSGASYILGKPCGCRAGVHTRPLIFTFSSFLFNTLLKSGPKSDPPKFAKEKME